MLNPCLLYTCELFTYSQLEKDEIMCTLEARGITPTIANCFYYETSFRLVSGLNSPFFIGFAFLVNARYYLEPNINCILRLDYE